MKKTNSFLKKNSPTIMGILNITPDSFSDGNKHNTLKKALKRAEEMEKEGADIIDIGGESTGVGSIFISEEEELKRVIPILKELRKRTKLPISIDTYKSEVAKQALQEGANMINDVTALRGDSRLAKVVAEHKCPIILMYSKDKSPRTTKKAKKHKNVIETISIFLKEQIKFAKKNGIKEENIIIDPGMGQFISSIPKYSYEIVAKLEELKKLNCPILVGISRKSFLQGEIENRDERAKTISAIAYINGVSIIRTHDVKGIKDFFKNFKV